MAHALVRQALCGFSDATSFKSMKNKTRFHGLSLTVRVSGSVQVTNSYVCLNLFAAMLQR
jgi:hypothetical protein